jgi:hypothetical protein
MFLKILINWSHVENIKSAPGLLHLAELHNPLCTVIEFLLINQGVQLGSHASDTHVDLHSITHLLITLL